VESPACETLAAEWEITNPSTISPVSYIANASHANYFTAGEHERPFPRPTDDANGDGAIITPAIMEVESAPVASLSALPRWFYWDGEWGSSGGGGLDQESPSGPARGDSRWEGLEAFAEEPEANCEVGGSGAFRFGIKQPSHARVLQSLVEHRNLDLRSRSTMRLETVTRLPSTSC